MEEEHVRVGGHVREDDEKIPMA